MFWFLFVSGFVFVGVCVLCRCLCNCFSYSRCLFAMMFLFL